METPVFATAHRTRRPALWSNQVRAFGIDHWSLDHLRSRFGNEPCSVSPYGRPVGEAFPSTLGRFFSDHWDTGLYTVTRVARRDADPGPVLGDVTFPNPFLAGLEEVEGHILLAGREGTGALPHRHGDALNLLVEGRKRWIMFDAATGTPGRELQEDHRRRYPSGSPVRAAEWFERERAPLLEQAAAMGIEVWEVTQVSGDVVYVPRDFTHAAVNLAPSHGLVLEIRPPAPSAVEP